MFMLSAVNSASLSCSLNLSTCPCHPQAISWYLTSKVLIIVPFDLIMVLINSDSHLVSVVRMMNSLSVDADKEKRENK